MVDFKSVLGTLLESGLAPSASQRIGHALGGRRVGGAGASTPGAGQGGGDLGSLRGGLLGNAKQAAGDTRREVEAGNPMAVGGLGALAGAVLGGMRGSPARGALGGAALAVLGQIAMSALQKGTGGTAAAGTGQPGLAEAPATAGTAGNQPTAATAAGTVDDDRAQLLLRAMINAAKADGQIDGAEMNRIMGKLDEAGADQEAKDFVLTEMRGPLDVDGLAAAARGAPDVAAAVYAASVMAIRVDTEAERTYLEQLAARLGLAPSVRASLDASLGVGGAAA